MIKVSKKQFAFILVAVCLVGLIGIGVSYSYYLANISTSNEENKNSDISTTTITKVVMDMQGKVSSDGAYPGHKMVKEVVVRGIGESNSIPANAAILVTPDLGDFTNDVTWKLYKSDTPITCSNVEHTKGGQFYEEATCNIPDSASLELEGGADKVYKNIVVKPNTETKYYLVVEYANKENQSDQMGKSFGVDIGIGEKITSTADIIAKLDTSDACPTINKNGDISSGYYFGPDGSFLCSALDEYGTTYFYRGNVKDNYINFGGYYWRITRINGDGSIRIVYNGTKPHENGEADNIGLSKFNEKNDDNKYVGYMYGSSDGVAIYSAAHLERANNYYVAMEYAYNASTDKFTLENYEIVSYDDLINYKGYYAATSSNASFINKIKWFDNGETFASVMMYDPNSRFQTQSNAVDSTIKKYLDTWYEKNFKGTKNEKYLSDNIFCNDRSGGENGQTETMYGSSEHNLKCPNKNDAFTVNDTRNGNGDLKYPIGLLSDDEYYFAYLGNDYYPTFYLLVPDDVWTMSPALYKPVARIDAFGVSGGGLGLDASQIESEERDFTWVDSKNGVQPVLNIKAGVYLLGDGTMENPYRVE